jgi:hypothetical protein
MNTVSSLAISKSLRDVAIRTVSSSVSSSPSVRCANAANIVRRFLPSYVRSLGEEVL